MTLNRIPFATAAAAVVTRLKDDTNGINTYVDDLSIFAFSGPWARVSVENAPFVVVRTRRIGFGSMHAGGEHNKDATVVLEVAAVLEETDNDEDSGSVIAIADAIYDSLDGHDITIHGTVTSRLYPLGFVIDEWQGLARAILTLQCDYLQEYTS